METVSRAATGARYRKSATLADSLWQLRTWGFAGPRGRLLTRRRGNGKGVPGEERRGDKCDEVSNIHFRRRLLGVLVGFSRFPNDNLVVSLLSWVSIVTDRLYLVSPS